MILSDCIVVTYRVNGNECAISPITPLAFLVWMYEDITCSAKWKQELRKMENIIDVVPEGEHHYNALMRLNE